MDTLIDFSDGLDLIFFTDFNAVYLELIVSVLNVDVSLDLIISEAVPYVNYS